MRAASPGGLIDSEWRPLAALSSWGARLGTGGGISSQEPPRNGAVLPERDHVEMPAAAPARGTGTLSLVPGDVPKPARPPEPPAHPGAPPNTSPHAMAAWIRRAATLLGEAAAQRACWQGDGCVAGARGKTCR